MGSSLCGERRILRGKKAAYAFRGDPHFSQRVEGDPLNVNKQTSSVSAQQRQNTKLHLWIHVLVEFTLIQRQRILCVLVNARKMCISLASAVLKAGLVMFPKNPQEVYKMGYISQWSLVFN